MVRSDLRSDLRSAIAEFVAAVAYQPCLLLVHPDVAVLERTTTAIAVEHGWSRLSIGRNLSGALLAEPPRRRGRAVQGYLTERLAAAGPGPLLLADLDLLFEPGLELEPPTLLRRLSRTARLAVAWPGSYAGSVLSYAVPAHAHYRSWRRPELPVVVLE